VSCESVRLVTLFFLSGRVGSHLYFMLGAYGGTDGKGEIRSAKGPEKQTEMALGASSRMIRRVLKL
jgi:hypothetical protein